MISVTQFYAAIGALLVSLIAFTIVFVVLACLIAIIVGKRYLATVLEKKDAGSESCLPEAISVSDSQTESALMPICRKPDDIKKVIAAVTAAINFSISNNMNISDTPVQCSDMNTRWRSMGIAECMKSRLGSRSW